MTLACARCLDSALVSTDAALTPWPTVLADWMLSYDAAEGVLRAGPCPSCPAAAPGRTLAAGDDAAGLKAWIEARLADLTRRRAA